jgi:hypothetical protein
MKTFVEKEQGKVEEHNAPEVLAKYDGTKSLSSIFK